jgi:divalent metal cation (Fe/Co/Zn/Cd) transporter
MRRIEETFAYLLSIIIFLAGLILILLSFLPFLSQNDLIANIIRGFGIALCPAGVIGFLYQYYTQKVFVKQLEDSIRANLFIPQRTWDKEDL